MHVSARSYLTMGVAVLGAGAIALAPVQPTHNSVAAPSAIGHQISFDAVNLAAATNPITLGLTVWNTSETAFTALVNSALNPPLPTLQQVGANWLRYGSELPDFGEIFNSIVTNFQAAIKAPFAVDTSTLTGLHPTIWSLLPSLITIPPALQPILDFTTTYTSGALIGLVGPIVAPIIAFGNSLQAAWTALNAGQLQDAVNEIINIPANMINAFLNGGKVLDLTPLVKSLLPSEVTSLGIMLGGLLSPGGSLFNSLDIVANVGFGAIPVPGVPAGTFGSLVALGGVIAKAIGWSGTGNPLHPGIPVPPPSGAATAASVAAPEAPEAPEADAGSDEGSVSESAAAASADAVDAPAAHSAPSKESGKLSKRPSAAASSAASSDKSAGSESSDSDTGNHGKGGSKRAKAGRDAA